MNNKAIAVSFISALKALIKLIFLIWILEKYLLADFYFNILLILIKENLCENNCLVNY